MSQKIEDQLQIVNDFLQQNIDKNWEENADFQERYANQMLKFSENNSQSDTKIYGNSSSMADEFLSENQQKIFQQFIEQFENIVRLNSEYETNNLESLSDLLKDIYPKMCYFLIVWFDYVQSTKNTHSSNTPGGPPALPIEMSHNLKQFVQKHIIPSSFERYKQGELIVNKTNNDLLSQTSKDGSTQPTNSFIDIEQKNRNIVKSLNIQNQIQMNDTNINDSNELIMQQQSKNNQQTQETLPPHSSSTPPTSTQQHQHQQQHQQQQQQQQQEPQKEGSEEKEYIPESDSNSSKSSTDSFTQRNIPSTRILHTLREWAVPVALVATLVGTTFMRNNNTNAGNENASDSNSSAGGRQRSPSVSVLQSSTNKL